jgi:hypothetical protein
MASDLYLVTITIRTASCDDGVHVMFDAREHDTDGIDCWCAPRYQTFCDECDGGCWKCERGTIHLTHEEAERTDVPIVIVHND